jgi:5-formyltetrahydrofolate cyclo-ligase
LINSNINIASPLKKKAPIPKLEARKIVQERAAEFSAINLQKKSSLIIDRLINSDDFNYASRIYAYYSTSGLLVNTKELINKAQGQGKSVFLPKHKQDRLPERFQFTAYNELVENDLEFLEPRFGIEEDLSDIDLIIVPSIAVSLLGERIGFERMNYNALLRNSFAPKIVLAYEFQVFNKIEYDRCDIRIDSIITERRIINTRKFS